MPCDRAGSDVTDWANPIVCRAEIHRGRPGERRLYVVNGQNDHAPGTPPFLVSTVADPACG